MIALFPGSFDPPTYGHLDIIARTRALFGSLAVIIAENHQKKAFFSVKMRKMMLETLLEAEIAKKTVEVFTTDRLLTDFIDEKWRGEKKIIIRGLRSAADFEKEYEMALINRELFPDCETFFLAAKPEMALVRSSSVRELASFGASGSFEAAITRFVPPLVAEELKKRVVSP